MFNSKKEQVSFIHNFVINSFVKSSDSNFSNEDSLKLIIDD